MSASKIEKNLLNEYIMLHFPLSVGLNVLSYLKFIENKAAVTPKWHSFCLPLGPFSKLINVHHIIHKLLIKWSSQSMTLNTFFNILYIFFYIQRT